MFDDNNNFVFRRLMKSHNWIRKTFLDMKHLDTKNLI